MGTDLRIVGIDPGTTSAVAVLRLDGEIVDYTSRRNFSKDRIIQFMVEGGKPLLVAADVSPAPSLVEEIASNTGSVLVEPDEDLEQERKDAITDEFPVAGEDTHVKDAVAAAEYARREYAATFDEIRRRVEEEGVEEQLDDVIELVVKGSLPLSGAISEVEKVKDVEPEEAGGGQERDWQRIAEKRKERIDLLERKVANLEEHVDQDAPDGTDEGVSEDELRRRNRLIRDLREEVEEKNAALERLEDERDRLAEALERLEQGWVRAPKVDDLSTAAREAVFVERYGGEDVGTEISTVLMEQPSAELAETGLDVVDVGEVERKVETRDAYILHPEELEGGNEQERFMEWLEAYRER